mgnify:CR=1 FL=1
MDPNSALPSRSFSRAHADHIPQRTRVDCVSPTSEMTRDHCLQDRRYSPRARSRLGSMPPRCRSHPPANPTTQSHPPACWSPPPISNQPPIPPPHPTPPRSHPAPTPLPHPPPCPSPPTSTPLHQNYVSGVDVPRSCNAQSVDHAVLIVGFGKDTAHPKKPCAVG